MHTEPFLGRASMLCFLYGPGEPGRYPATANAIPTHFRHSEYRFMSYEINISASTQYSAMEVASWMCSFPFQDRWEYEREPLENDDDAVLNHYVDDGYFRSIISRPRWTGPFHKSWFTSESTVCIDTKVRTRTTIGRFDTVFAVGLELCNHDSDCDLLLVANGEEVFVKTTGKLFIQQNYFQAASLAAMLPKQYFVMKRRFCDIPDDDRRNLIEHSW